MLLKITHTTDLTYTDVINETVMALRMAPRQEQDQHRLSFTLGIGPATPVTSYFDWLGNTIHTFTINPFHQQIRIVATSVVETDRPVADVASLPDRWPVQTRGDYTMWDYLQFGGAVVDCPPLRDLANALDAREGMPLGELGMRMLGLIDREFAYEKGVTTAASPITDVLTHRRGVCQDFTHLMIGLWRALGVPARYASGYLHPERTRYRGYTQTHAWCEAMFPSIGWVGFDPTNNCTLTENFVRVAVGRDYADVPPNKGVYKGPGKESMAVAVQSERLDRVPMSLPGERIDALPVGWATSDLDAPERSSRHHQEVQQQQAKADMGTEQQAQQQQ